MMIKKLYSILLAVVLALTVMCGFVACGNVDFPDGTGGDHIGGDTNDGDKNDDDKKDENGNGDGDGDGNGSAAPQIYYCYDAQTEAYDDADRITVTGTVCVWNSVDIALGSALEFEGSVSYNGDKFVMTLNGSFSIADTCVVTYRGVRESDGVLRVDSTVVTVYSELVETPTVTTDTTVTYYCKKGDKPASVIPGPGPSQPVLEGHSVSFGCNGGAFANGDSSVTATTDRNGKVTFPSDPTRQGYIFRGWYEGTNKVSSGTVFDDDTVVIAWWAEEVTVTFRDGNSVIRTVKRAKGDVLGDFAAPRDPDGRVFDGWYSGGVQFFSYSVINSDTVLTARWRSTNAAEQYMASLSSWDMPGHLYIHYLRVDHLASEEGRVNDTAPVYGSGITTAVYGDWLLWAWPKSNPNGRAFYPARIDMSGAVYDIDLSYTFTDCGWDGIEKQPLNLTNSFGGGDIGFQLFRGSSMMGDGFWINDGGDIYLTEEQIAARHVFYRQGGGYLGVSLTFGGASATDDDKYYLYDAETDTYDESECLYVNGDDITVFLSGDGEVIKSLEVSGRITERNGADFTAACEMPINRLSDLFTDDMAAELGSLVGYSRLDAKLRIDIEGQISDTAVHVTYISVEFSGFTGFLDYLNTGEREYPDAYYCKKNA